MKYGILGYGYVGKATHYGLLKKQNCSIYDILFDTKKDVLNDVDVIFICIPTNTDDDVDIIINEINNFKKINPNFLPVIRSTLPLGASAKIQKQVGSIIYIPEFLRERYWETDCLKRPLVVGHDNTDIPKWLLAEEIVQCTTAEAELVKMFSNNFATVRIAFANVFYDLAQTVGADYDVIKDTYFKIQHNQTYMEVPGHDGSRGFKGTCLPKDLDFLINTLDKNGIDQNWFKHIRKLNEGWQDEF